LIAFFIAIVNANKDNLYKELVEDDINLEKIISISLTNNLKTNNAYMQIVEIIVAIVFQYYCTINLHSYLPGICLEFIRNLSEIY